MNPFKKILQYAGDHIAGSGRGPFHEENGPLVRPPAGGPGTIPGQQQPFPIGDHRQPGGNIPQTQIPAVGVNAPNSGGSMATGDEANGGGPSGGFDWKNWALDHWDDLVKLGITAFTTKEALDNSNKSNALMDEGLGMAKQDYAGRQPFRDAAMTNLLDPRTPDLSPLFANSGNPYAKGRQIPVVGNRIPASATMPDLKPPTPPSGPTQPVTVPFSFGPGYNGPTGTPDLPTTPLTNPAPTRRRIAAVGSYTP